MRLKIFGRVAAVLFVMVLSGCSSDIKKQDTERSGSNFKRQQGCVFCEIIANQPDKILFENDHVVVIKTRHPVAPIHYLIIPKKHITDLTELDDNDYPLAGSFLMMAKQLSESDTKARHFRLVNNNGRLAAQTVFHAHIHFLAGKKFRWNDFIH